MAKFVQIDTIIDVAVQFSTISNLTDILLIIPTMYVAVKTSQNSLQGQKILEQYFLERKKSKILIKWSSNLLI